MHPSLLQHVLYALLILVAGYLVGSWLGGATRSRLERSRLDTAVRTPLARFVRPLVLLLALLAALRVVGVDLTALVAILGAAVLAIGLSLRDTLSNVAAGAVLLTLRPFRGGDYVKAGGAAGTVLELSLFTTTLKTAHGVHTVVPNALLLEAPIENYTRNGLRRADLEIRVAAGSDVVKAKEALEAALAAEPRSLEDPAPAVRLLDLDAQGIDLLVAAWFKNEDFAEGRSALISAVRDALKKAKIELTSTSTIVAAP